MEVDTRLVLASGSPRRQQLLDLIGIPYRIRPTDLDEIQSPGESAVNFAVRAARDKALAVTGLDPGVPVLGSDTVVEVGGLTLGKPCSAGEAKEMLRRLSGVSHNVHTGIALVVGNRCESLVDTTAVRFHPLTDEMIDWYVATGEPMDKAGAYALQGRGGLLVAALEGSPHTVVGLPIHRLPELFRLCGVDFWQLLISSPG